LRSGGEIRVNHENIVFEDDPTVVAVSLLLDISLVKVDAGGDWDSFIDFVGGVRLAGSRLRPYLGSSGNCGGSQQKVSSRDVAHRADHDIASVRGPRVRLSPLSYSSVSCHPVLGQRAASCFPADAGSPDTAGPTLSTLQPGAVLVIAVPFVPVITIFIIDRPQEVLKGPVSHFPALSSPHLVREPEVDAYINPGVHNIPSCVREAIIRARLLNDERISAVECKGEMIRPKKSASMRVAASVTLFAPEV
jgi:hypothetical protein